MSTFNTVLITTSGTGSRLGNLTTYTNKSLVRVGAKAALSHIIDAYPKDTKFVVTIGYLGYLVEQYLQIAHPDSNITIVSVSPYEGPGSSLVYSMSCAEKHLQCPFIYHCCDSVVKTPSLPDSNWIGYSTGVQDFGNYRTISFANKHVYRVNEKGIRGDGIYIGVTGIKDYKEFWEQAHNLLHANTLELSDANVVHQLISKGIEFSPIEFTNWFDIGNIGSLEHARKNIWGERFTTLEKEDQAVHLLEDRVVKFFYSPRLVKNRVDRAETLKGAVPNILDHTDNFYSYSRINGITFTEHLDRTLFRKFLNWCNDNLWDTDVDQTLCKELCYDFYINKTRKRVHAAHSKLGITGDPVIINRVHVDSINHYLKHLEANDHYIHGRLCTRYHGDLHNGNIFYDGDTFGLIDWREGFGNQITYGDIYYDLAKLNHGLIVSHDIVENNMFSVVGSDNYISIDILQKFTLVDCQKELEEFVNNSGLSWFKVELITALIFLNISPLHHSPYDRFLYYLGRLRLEQTLNGSLRTQA